MNCVHDVAVLGAGIAGSSLAKDLADKGWDTLLIDRRRFPRHKVCGEFLSPEFQGMLQGIGMREVVESLRPALMNRARLILSEGDTLEIPLPGTAWGLSRYTLDSTLHSVAKLSGVNLQMGVTVTSVYPENGGYTIETSQQGDRDVLHVRAVIAAWGAHHRMGTQNLSRNGSSTHKYVGVKSHFTGIDTNSAVELYFFRGGYLGISPIQDGGVNFAALLAREAFRDSDKTVLGMISEAARRNPMLYDRMRAAFPVPGTQAAVSPVDLHKELVAWDQFALVGDASVMVPPLCGDGMSMALRSSRLCSVFADGYLKGNIPLSQWQHEYSKILQQEFSGPLRWGNRMQSLCELTVFPRILLGMAKFIPGLAAFLIKATRLNERDMLSRI